MKHYKYVTVPVAERKPDLFHYVNDKLILLDADHDVLRMVRVGFLTDWDYISDKAVYWLEKQEAFTDENIVDTMEDDLVEDGVPVGHAYSLVNHWRNKYFITNRTT